MFGYQIDHKFEDISYLITRSCWYTEIEEDTDESGTITYPSDYSFASMKSNLSDTKQESSKFNNSTEYLAIGEDKNS